MKKLNIIDVFIIVLIVLTILGVGIRLGVNAYLNEKNNSEYYLVVKATGVDTAKENALRAGDMIAFSDTSNDMGIIQEVTFENYSSDENGQNTKCDALVTLSVKGNISQKGFMHEDGTYLYVGQSIVIKSDSFEGEVLIIGINDKNE